MPHPTKEIIKLATEIQKQLDAGNSIAFCATCRLILYTQEVNSAATRRVLADTAQNHGEQLGHVTEIIRPQPII